MVRSRHWEWRSIGGGLGRLDVLDLVHREWRGRATARGGKKSMPSKGAGRRADRQSRARRWWMGKAWLPWWPLPRPFSRA